MNTQYIIQRIPDTRFCVLTKVHDLLGQTSYIRKFISDVSCEARGLIFRQSEYQHPCTQCGLWYLLISAGTSEPLLLDNLIINKISKFQLMTYKHRQMI